MDSGSHPDLEAVQEKSRAGLGRGNKVVGPRISPVLPHLEGYDYGSADSGSDILGKQIEMEADNAIK